MNSAIEPGCPRTLDPHMVMGDIPGLNVAMAQEVAQAAQICIAPAAR